MTLRIDGAGRIVVPKPLRDRLGLRGGSEIEISEVPDGLLLKPLREEPSMKEVNGLWVHQGKIPPGFDWGGFFEDQREKRVRKTHGL